MEPPPNLPMSLDSDESCLAAPAVLPGLLPRSQPFHATPEAVSLPVEKVRASTPEYMVQLNALRAFATLGVFYFHFYEAGAPGRFPVGGWGVQLFFVLSGFLITGILLKSRDIGHKSGGIGRQLKLFYIRRSIRIFPLFYFVIFATALINVPTIRESIGWHLTYTSNFYFALQGKFAGPASHFWSLAVEEQFYLIWPCVILFVPAKYILRVIIAAILTAPVFQIAGHMAGLKPITVNLMMTGCLGFLGTGGLLAYFRHRYPDQFTKLAGRKSYLWAGIVLFLGIACFDLRQPRDIYSTAVLSIVTCAVFGWFVHKAAVGFGGAFGKLLEFKPLLYLGQISYGMYVYHEFMPTLVYRAFSKLHIPFPEAVGPQFLLLTAVTIAVATCSWFLFESPINRLKKHFDYR